MNADLTVMRFFAAPLTREESDEAIDRYTAQLSRDGFSMLALEERATGEFLGVLGMQTMTFAIPNLPQPAVEIGWRLALAAQGRGFATEGARAVVAYAFNELRLREVVAITTPANAASRRVMDKLGMIHREDLTFAHPRVPADHPNQPHIVYQLRNPS